MLTQLEQITAWSQIVQVRLLYAQATHELFIVYTAFLMIWLVTWKQTSKRALVSKLWENKTTVHESLFKLPFGCRPSPDDATVRVIPGKSDLP